MLVATMQFNCTSCAIHGRNAVHAECGSPAKCVAVDSKSAPRSCDHAQLPHVGQHWSGPIKDLSIFQICLLFIDQSYYLGCGKQPQKIK
jgi:hypothetical protein